MQRQWWLGAFGLIFLLLPVSANAQSCADQILAKVQPDQNMQAAFEALATCIVVQQAEIEKLKVDAHKQLHNHDSAYLRLDDVRKQTVPSGAIIASENECETLDGNWSTYTPATARFIVGAGTEFNAKHQDWFMQLPSGGVERILLESYQTQTSGGELEVKLTEGQMPEHSHQIKLNQAVDPNTAYKWGLVNTRRIEEVRFGDRIFTRAEAGTLPHLLESSKTGKFEPHNNMPPYIALFFCKKD